MMGFSPTDGWIGKDIPKLQAASVQSYLLITVATPLDIPPHPYYRSLKHLNSASLGARKAERKRALDFYARWGAHVGAGPQSIWHLDLGTGETPGPTPGSVALDVIIIGVPALERRTSHEAAGSVLSGVADGDVNP
jgi:hypothetical protein